MMPHVSKVKLRIIYYVPGNWACCVGDGPEKGNKNLGFMMFRFKAVTITICAKELPNIPHRHKSVIDANGLQNFVDERVSYAQLIRNL